jgi:hypothetical protein
MLKSGVHATLTGVILAMFIPMRSQSDPDERPLHDWEHDLHVLVAFMILPVLAFANAGLSLQGMGLEQLLHGVNMLFDERLGIIVGSLLSGVVGYMALRCSLKAVDEAVAHQGNCRLPGSHLRQRGLARTGEASGLLEVEEVSGQHVGRGGGDDTVGKVSLAPVDLQAHAFDQIQLEADALGIGRLRHQVRVTA